MNQPAQEGTWPARVCLELNASTHPPPEAVRCSALLALHDQLYFLAHRVRLSNFKSNEYADLLGGRHHEPMEENPMLGFRSAARYYDSHYRDGFALECQAMRKVRDEMGLTNVKLMIPFCRTVDEGRKVLAELQQHGLRQGENGLEVYILWPTCGERESAAVFPGN